MKVWIGQSRNQQVTLEIIFIQIIIVQRYTQKLLNAQDSSNTKLKIKYLNMYFLCLLIQYLSNFQQFFLQEIVKNQFNCKVQKIKEIIQDNIISIYTFTFTKFIINKNLFKNLETFSIQLVLNTLIKKQIINQMSSQQNQISEQDAQKNNKTKQQRQKQKANTNAWLKKQQQKKKKKQQAKEQQKQPQELDQKALQKARIKQQRRLERQKMLKQQEKASGQVKPNKQQTKKQQNKTTKKQQQKQVKVQKQENKKEKKKQQKPTKDNNQTQKKNVADQQSQKLRTSGNSKKQQKEVKTQATSNKELKNATLAPQSLPKHIYPELKTLQSHLKASKQFPFILSNKETQQKFIFKELQQYLSPNDSILILSKSDKWIPQARLYNRRVFLYPNHEQFLKNKEQDIITCTYEDIALLMQGTLTKIFIELELVFANGFSLTQKGHQNIITLANQFKIPVIGLTGTWNFNGWNYLSQETLLNKYGQKPLVEYDVLQNSSYQIIVMQIGSVVPKQVSGHWDNIQKIYRGHDLNTIQW